MSNEWFALRVRAKAEAMVDEALRRKSYETFLPSHTEWRQYRDRMKKVEAALFPGYLFCRFNPDCRLPILTTFGVQCIVSFNEKPAPVDEAELAALRRIVSANTSLKPWPFLKVGDRARIEVGVLAGVEGILLAEKRTDLLILSVSLLQRSVAVQIDRTCVRPLSTPVSRAAKGLNATS